jgi:hypothetical protein
VETVEPPPVVTPNRALVGSYGSEAEAAQGWLTFNLPGLEPELEPVAVSGKKRLVRLYAVGPAEVVRQLCDDPVTRGDWCGAGK